MSTDIDRFSGAVTDHETLNIVVAPPVLPVDVEAHALAASREKALTITDDRRLLLAACAVEVERELGRIVWPPSGRESTTVVIVRNRDFAVPYCKLYPLTVTQALTSVRMWSDDAQDWTTLMHGIGYRYSPNLAHPRDCGRAVRDCLNPHGPDAGTPQRG